MNEASPAATPSSKQNNKKRGPKPQSQQQESSSKKPQQPRSAKLRGHPRDSPDTQLSKTLSWLLRHGAQSEGLPMRPDGYVLVRDLLAVPRLSSLDFPKLQQMVASDSKGRYNLISEGPADVESIDGWWIRANQGHTIKVEIDYEPLTSSSQVPMAVHGTTRSSWEMISKKGLSKMRRTHIHMAQGVPGSGVISGMRNSADILIYIDLQKALDEGIKFFLSANGVVLTAGDDTGFLKPEFFSRVEDKKGVPLPGWEGNKASTTQELNVQSNEATTPIPTKVEELAADTLITKEAPSGTSTPAI